MYYFKTETQGYSEALTKMIFYYKDDFLIEKAVKSSGYNPPALPLVVASCNQLTALNHTYAGKETAKRCLVGCSAEPKAVL